MFSRLVGPGIRFLGALNVGVAGALALGAETEEGMGGAGAGAGAGAGGSGAGGEAQAIVIRDRGVCRYSTALRVLQTVFCFFFCPVRDGLNLYR